MGHIKSINICTYHVYRVSVYSAVYQIAYQRQVNVIAMSNQSKVFLQLIDTTLLGLKKIFDKTQRMCISLNSRNDFL